MSGRLIILGKKSYAPWRSENVERVLRDERLERERLQREEEKCREVKGRERNERLKSEADAFGGRSSDAIEVGTVGGNRNSGTADASTTVTVNCHRPQIGHINLFAEEEHQMLDNATGGYKVSSSSSKVGVGVMPEFLGGNEAANRSESILPFYMRSRSSDLQEAYGLRKKDERLKSREDPMVAFMKTDNNDGGTDNNDEGKGNINGCHKRRLGRNSLDNDSTSQCFVLKPLTVEKSEKGSASDDRSIVLRPNKQEDRCPRRHPRKRSTRQWNESDSSNRCISSSKSTGGHGQMGRVVGDKIEVNRPRSNRKRCRGSSDKRTRGRKRNNLHGCERLQRKEGRREIRFGKRRRSESNSSGSHRSSSSWSSSSSMLSSSSLSSSSSFHDNGGYGRRRREMRRDNGDKFEVNRRRSKRKRCRDNKHTNREGKMNCNRNRSSFATRFPQQRRREETSSSKRNDSMEELRERRLQRERKESLRQIHVAANHQMKHWSETTNDVNDDRSRRYQDQYNPSLSRL